MHFPDSTLPYLPPNLGQWLQRAVQLHSQDRFVEASELYSLILKLQPELLHAKHLLGILRLDQGRLEDALALLTEVAAVNGGSAEAHADCGSVQLKLGRFAEALDSYDRAIALSSDKAIFFCNRAAALIKLHRDQDAIASADRAIALMPDYADAHYNRGKALLDLGRDGEALASFDEALKLRPGDVDTLNNRGLALAALGRNEDALSSYDAALRIRPLNAEALNNRGLALLALGRFEASLLSYDLAIKLKSDHAPAHCNRGVVLNELRRFAEALASSDQALELKPDLFEAFVSRAIILKNLDRLEEALDSFEQVVAWKPNSPSGFGNRALALKQLGRIEESRASFAAGLALNPGHIELRFGEALLLLLAGDLQAGWEGYETRFQQPRSTPRKLSADYVVWNGEDLAGRSIIVYIEQGFGDIIQFVRYLPLLAARGAEVTCLIGPALQRLLKPLGTSARLVDTRPERHFDFQSALLSLPRAFQTTLSTIPAVVPYLEAEEPLIQTWADRIGTEGFRIGIAWQGNPAGIVDFGRSFPLALMQPIADIPGVRLISLQKNHGIEQLATLPQSMQVEIIDPAIDSGPDVFVDTAAIMASLDLIITSDTSIAHLAGALGRPVWIALKHIPDWRWLLDREDTPWYPTMRVFRQPKRGDWAGIFDAMAHDLREMVLTRIGESGD